MASLDRYGSYTISTQASPHKVEVYGTDEEILIQQLEAALADLRKGRKEEESGIGAPVASEEPKTTPVHPGNGTYYVSRGEYSDSWVRTIKIDGDAVYWLDINVNGYGARSLYPLKVDKLLKHWRIVGRKSFQ